MGVEVVRLAAQTLHTDRGDDADFFFTTVHKSKGLEWHDVYVSGDLYSQGSEPPGSWPCVSTVSPPKECAALFENPFEEVNIACKPGPMHSLPLIPFHSFASPVIDVLPQTWPLLERSRICGFKARRNRGFRRVS